MQYSLNYSCNAVASEFLELCSSLLQFSEFLNAIHWIYECMIGCRMSTSKIVFCSTTAFFFSFTCLKLNALLSKKLQRPPASMPQPNPTSLVTTWRLPPLRSQICHLQRVALNWTNGIHRAQPLQPASTPIILGYKHVLTWFLLIWTWIAPSTSVQEL